MRAFVLLGFAAAICAVATPSFAFPTGSEAIEARLLAKMGPDAKAWILKEGSREASARLVSGESARSAAFQYGATGANLDALAFLALMQAERAAASMVSTVAADDISANASKQDERRAQQSSQLTSSAQQSQLSGGDQLANSAQGSAAVSLLPSGKATVPLTLRTNAPNASTPPPPGMNLQDAMDRESQFDDLVTEAMTHVGPAQESAVTAMP